MIEALGIGSILYQMNEYSFKCSRNDIIILFFWMFTNIFMENNLFKLKVLLKCSEKGEARSPLIMFSQQSINIFTDIDDSGQLASRDIDFFDTFSPLFKGTTR